MVMGPPFEEQHGQVARGGGMLQNRWGTVFEKLAVSSGNDSEESHLATSADPAQGLAAPGTHTRRSTSQPRPLEISIGANGCDSLR